MCQPTHGEGQESTQLQTLFAEQYHHLVGLAGRYVDQRDLCEEVVQDVFAAYHALASRPAAGKEVAYLRCAVLNRARSVLRRRLVRDRHRCEAPMTARPAEEEVLIGETATTLWALVAALPERQRAVMIHRHVWGMTEAEIAERMGVSTGTVKTHAARARSSLRQALSAIG